MSGGIDQGIPFGQLVVWMVLEGTGSVRANRTDEPCPFGPGDTVVLPAGLNAPHLATEVDCKWLEITVPTA